MAVRKVTYIDTKGNKKTKYVTVNEDKVKNDSKTIFNVSSKNTNNYAWQNRDYGTGKTVNSNVTKYSNDGKGNISTTYKNGTTKKTNTKKTTSNKFTLSDKSGVNAKVTKYDNNEKTNVFQNTLDKINNDIDNKYKPQEDNLNSREQTAKNNLFGNYNDAYTNLQTAQRFSALAEQNPDMAGSEDANAIADNALKNVENKTQQTNVNRNEIQNINTAQNELYRAKKTEKDTANKVVYDEAAKSLDNYAERAKQGEQIKDTLNTFEDDEAQKYMTDEEKTKYNAFKTESIGTAHDYYLTIQQELFDRQAQSEYQEQLDKQENVALGFENIRAEIEQLDDSPIKNILQNSMYFTENAYNSINQGQRAGTTALAAVRRWGKDISNLPAAFTGSTDVLEQTAIEKLSEYQSADMKGIEAVVNDIIDTVAYQAPNIGAGIATGGAALAVNTGMVFATSFSSSYTEATSEGYPPETAQEYAFSMGMVEAGLSFVLNGVELQGGNIMNTLKTYLKTGMADDTVSSSLKTITTGFLKNMVSEGAEEGLQEVLGTLIGNSVLSRNEDINWQNVGYAAFLGSLSAGIMNAPTSFNSIVADAQIKVREQKAQALQANSAEIYINNIEAVSEIVNTLPENNKARTEAETVIRDIRRGKNISDEKIVTTLDDAINEAGNIEFKNLVDEAAKNVEEFNTNLITDENGQIIDSIATAENNEMQNVAAYENAQIEEISDTVQEKPYNENNVSDEYLKSVDDKILKFVNEVEQGTSNKKSIELNAPTKRAITDIKEILGRDVSGYKTQIEARQVQHILKDHGKNGRADHSMANNNDIARIQYVLDNYDDMEDGGKGTAYREKKQNGYNSGSPTIKYSKKVDGTYYVVEAVPDTKAKSLYVVSAYISKKNNQQAADVQAPAITSETEATDYNSNIPQTKEKSNSTKSKREPVKTITSNIAETVKNATFMTEEGINEITKLIEDGALDYEVYTDKKAVNDAERSIERNGVDVVANSFSKKVADGEAITKGDVVEAQKAFEQYIKDGEIDKATNLLFDMRASATNAGQVAQAFSLIDYATPAGRVMLMNKIKDRLQSEINRKYRNSGVELELNPTLLERLANSNTKEEMEAATQAIQEDLTAQLPISFRDRMNAWRYFAMLFNPKTHIRNIVGNVAFAPLIETKNGIGAFFEKFIPKEQRTKSILTPKDKALREYASEQFDTIKDELAQSNRNTDTKSLWNDRKIFGNGKLESLRKFAMNLLEAEDMLFKKRTYISSYAQAMKARGYTAETITNKARIEIHEYAAQEALKSTYQDASSLAQALNRISDNHKVAGFIIEGLIPFKKTPINILKRGIEYSPINIIRGIYDMATKVKNGDMSAAQGIDSISSGLTGTGIMALGAFLMSMGFIEIGYDDENEETMSTLTGNQSYAIRIGDQTYSIDWLVPTAMPFLTGAYVYKSFEDGFDITDFSEVLNAMVKMSEPLMETSMLQGISNSIKYASYGDTESALINVAIGAVESYAGQYIPSVANMFARIIDDTQRTYYNDKTTGVPDFAQTIIYNAQNKIPGVSMLLNPKIDRWGREMKTDTLERVLEATVSPGYYSKDNITDVDEEINRLYQQLGDASVIPPAPSKYVTINGERIDFTSKQYTDFQKNLGSNAFDGVQNLIKTQVYKDMSDKEKAEAISIVYDYAKQNAYYQTNKNYERDKWVTVLSNDDIDISVYAGYKTKAKEIDEDDNLTSTQKKEQKISLIQDMSDKDKIDMYSLEFESNDTDKRKTIEYAQSIGVSPDNFLEWQVKEANIKGDTDLSTKNEDLYYENGEIIRSEDTPSTVSGSKKQKDCAALLSSGYSDTEKDYFYQMSYGTDNKYAQARADGIKTDDYLQYFADGVNNFSADKDEEGNSISGTKKAKVLSYIANMNISDDQKLYFAQNIAGYDKVDDISEINAYKDYESDGSSKSGKSSGYSGGSGKRSTKNSNASVKQLASAILSIANKASTAKTPTIKGLQAFDMSYNNDIMQKTKAQELAAIDNNPFYTSEMKNKFKKEIQARYS